MATGQPGRFSVQPEDPESGLTISTTESSQASYLVLPRTNTGALRELATAFWGAQLSFNSHRHGNPLVAFDSLWPTGEELRRAVEDFKQSQLESCVLDCCRLTAICGPARVLRAMLEAKVIGVDQVFQPHGITLLHMACLAPSPEILKMLLEFKPNYTSDLKMRTALGLCHDAQMRDFFPVTERVKDALKRKLPTSRDLPTDKSDIFDMASEPMKSVEVLIALQGMEPLLDLNLECNEDGDYLVHVAVTCGLPQMALLLALRRLYGVDFNIANKAGLTPLCIAIQATELYLVELLICVLGADPNMANPETGCTPLHYAARHCNPAIINTLIKRGALVNIENKNGQHADDIVPHSHPNHRECVHLIHSERENHMIRLTSKTVHVRLSMDEDGIIGVAGTLCQEDLHTSDLFTVNQYGNTLLMEAALNDRSAMISLLCSQLPQESSTEKPQAPNLVNAQHPKSGQTALALCAKAGNAGSLQQLLRHGANPQIADMGGMLPLHLACYHGHKECVDLLLQPIDGLLGLSKAIELTNNAQILSLLDKAHLRRQEEVIKPLLFECVQGQGNYEKLGAFKWEDEDDVNCLNEYKDWPLFLAAQNGSLEIVQFLFERGGSVTKCHEISQDTPLHAACRRDHLAVVEFLVEFTTSGSSRLAGLDFQRSLRLKGQSLMDINLCNSNGHTALALAVCQGSGQIVNLLCHPHYGASCNIPDSSGQLLSTKQFTGVQRSLNKFRQQHMERIVKLFSDKKNFAALKCLWVSPHDHTLSNNNGNSPLMVACESSARMEVIRFLLSDLIPKSPTASSASSTPQTSTLLDLSMSSLSGKHSGMPFPSQTFCTSASDSETSSCGQADNEGGHLTDSLCGAEVVCHCEQASTPSSASDLERSASSLNLGTNLTCCKEPQHDLLLRRNRSGFTALHCAIQAKHTKAAVVIIQADLRIVNIADNDGNTPIHLAARTDQKDIVKTVPSIHLDLENKEYKTAEDLAQRRVATLIHKARVKMKESRKAFALQSGKDISSPSRISHNMMPSKLSGESEMDATLDSPIDYEYDQLMSSFEALKRNRHS